MHEGPGIEIKKPNMWPAGKVAANFNKQTQNKQTWKLTTNVLDA